MINHITYKEIKATFTDKYAGTVYIPISQIQQYLGKPVDDSDIDKLVRSLGGTGNFDYQVEEDNLAVTITKATSFVSGNQPPLLALIESMITMIDSWITLRDGTRNVEAINLMCVE